MKFALGENSLYFEYWIDFLLWDMTEKDTFKQKNF